MGWNDDHPILFKYGITGPYEQYLGMSVRDHGNGLNIEIGCMTGDPPGSTGTTWSVFDAKRIHEKLGKAIEEAEKAGLK